MGRYIWDSTQTKASLNPGAGTNSLHSSPSPYLNATSSKAPPKSVYRHSFDFHNDKSPLRMDPGVRHRREFSYNPITHEQAAGGVFTLPSDFHAKPAESSFYAGQRPWHNRNSSMDLTGKRRGILPPIYYKSRPESPLHPIGDLGLEK